MKPSWSGTQVPYDQYDIDAALIYKSLPSILLGFLIVKIATHDTILLDNHCMTRIVIKRETLMSTPVLSRRNCPAALPLFTCWRNNPQEIHISSLSQIPGEQLYAVNLSALRSLIVYAPRSHRNYHPQANSLHCKLPRVQCLTLPHSKRSPPVLASSSEKISVCPRHNAVLVQTCLPLEIPKRRHRLLL